MDFELAGRTALITSGYRGTGRGIANTLAAEGMRVIVHGFEAGQPDDAVQEIIAAGGSASGVVADITSDQGAEALDEVAGTIDVLVNNYGAPGGSDWSTIDHWQHEWNTNVLTGVRVAQRCIPGMRNRKWGRVIFLGTVGTRRPGTRNPGYYGAKTALPTVVRTLAMELRGSGVTANLVSPGMIATDEVKAMVMRRAERHGQGATWDEAEQWALAKSMPNLTEQIATPADIGRVVAFVASQAAWHINGAEIPVDGGAQDA